MVRIISPGASRSSDVKNLLWIHVQHWAVQWRSHEPPQASSWEIGIKIDRKCCSRQKNCSGIKTYMILNNNTDFRNAASWCCVVQESLANSAPTCSTGGTTGINLGCISAPKISRNRSFSSILSTNQTIYIGPFAEAGMAYRTWRITRRPQLHLPSPVRLMKMYSQTHQGPNSSAHSLRL